MTPIEFESEISEAVNLLAPLPQEELAKFMKLGTFKKLKKREAWIREGQAVNDFAFIGKGFLKAFYTTLEGNQFIRNFSFENEFMAPYTALLTNQNALVTIEAVEDSELVLFPYDKVLEMRQAHPCWEAITRRIAEVYYVHRERRQYSLLTLDAAERYLRFTKEMGNHLSRISQQDVASYVGITPVSLSRIRANLKKTT